MSEELKDGWYVVETMGYGIQLDEYCYDCSPDCWARFPVEKILAGPFEPEDVQKALNAQERLDAIKNCIHDMLSMCYCRTDPIPYELILKHSKDSRHTFKGRPIINSNMMKNMKCPFPSSDENL